MQFLFHALSEIHFIRRINMFLSHKYENIAGAGDNI